MDNAAPATTTPTPPATPPVRRRRRRGLGWLWFLLGLLTGAVAVLSVIVVLTLFSPPPPPLPPATPVIRIGVSSEYLTRIINEQLQANPQTATTTVQVRPPGLISATREFSVEILGQRLTATPTFEAALDVQSGRVITRNLTIGFGNFQAGILRGPVEAAVAQAEEQVNAALATILTPTGLQLARLSGDGTYVVLDLVERAP